MKVGTVVAALAALVSGASIARAEPERSRFGAGGYFRIMTRPDFQGGDGKLGFWNLYGRLLNEGPYAALELKLDLLQRVNDTHKPWTAIHAKIEGGSVANADLLNGSLAAFRLSQLYALAGNVVFRDVTWQLGTLDSYFGDLGLYDMKPAQLFYETLGLSARYQRGVVDALIGVGDSGYFIRRDHYSPLLTAGASIKLKLGPGFEVGFGGQVMLEPKVGGNRFAPQATPGIDYTDLVRGEVVETMVAEDPQALDQFPHPVAKSDMPWRGIFYLGFGAGPLRWNNLFARIERRPSDTSVTETYQGRDFTLHVHDLTDERYQLLIGNEAQFTLVEGRLDLVWGVLFGMQWDDDNRVAPSDDQRTFYSTVVRLQTYLTDDLHLLAESSFAREISLNGNRFRKHGDSVFQSTDGLSDPRGLAYGDSHVRDTWQLKIGPVLSPLGLGVWTRPSFRILYGLQWSSQINAFGNSFVESLDQFNVYGAPDQRWHHLLALEVEAWF